jgi:integrase
MATELNRTTTAESLVSRENKPLSEIAEAGLAANHYAAQSSFTDYLSRKALRTIQAQLSDLAVFAMYLADAGIQKPPSAVALQTEPSAWCGVTWGLVDGFVKWQLQQGYAISSLNRRLSTIKSYAKLAARGGVISPEELALVKTVMGYGATEIKRINSRRATTRIGEKKASSVRIQPEQARQLKNQPDTPQGRRDTLLMCLLLDHGLRVSEVALLTVEQFDFRGGLFTFDRPKVDLEQTHKLSGDTLRALYAYTQAGDCPATGFLLRESRKSGALTEAGLSERAVKARVRLLGERVGLMGLSPHDCRHYWATYWANKVDVLRLQEAGGWSSLEMPRRYVERAKIANEGMA